MTKVGNSHPPTERAYKKVLGTPFLNISRYPNTDNYLKKPFYMKTGTNIERKKLEGSGYTRRNFK